MSKKKTNSRLKKELLSFAVAIVIVILILYFSETNVYSTFEAYLYEIPYVQEILNEYYRLDEIPVTSVKSDINIENSVSEKIDLQKNKLNVIYFSVGQADCQLVYLDGKTMLIDAGNTRDGEKIVSALRALGIQKLDYVVGTHVHEDHMGGMSYIVDAFDIDKFYMPYDTHTTSNYYKKLLTSLTNKKVSVNKANVGDKIDFGRGTFEVMAVDNSEPDNINLQSIVLQLSFGNQKYLFTGDAESENEATRKWDDVDVLKVGHHGSNTSSSQEFLNQVLPEIAIIQVGKDNSYGLPKDKIINRLEKLGSKIYRTDEDGTIQLVSDGSTNEIIKIDISFDGNN